MEKAVQDRLENGPRPGMAFWRFRLGREEIVLRGFAAFILMISVLALASVLGNNNMEVIQDVDTMWNCTIPSSLLKGSSLQHSINVFGGIFLSLTFLAVLYQIVWIILRYINFGCITNYYRTFLRIDISLSTIAMVVCIGGIVGCFYLGRLLNSLYDVRALGLIGFSAGLWVGFGAYIGGLFLLYSLNMHLAVSKDKIIEGCSS